MKPIYTLQWLEQEAEAIAGHWNGSDAKFVDGNGEQRTDEEAQSAQELLVQIGEVRDLVKELGI
jgi:hypothetical protein